MSSFPSSESFLAELRSFVDRVDRLDPDAPPWARLTIDLDGYATALTIRGPVARALVAAMQEYRAPRDAGHCDHCADGRVDENLVCRNCGRPNGVFGQIIMERAAQYRGSEAIHPGPPSPQEPEPGDYSGRGADRGAQGSARGEPVWWWSMGVGRRPLGCGCGNC